MQQVDARLRQVDIDRIELGDDGQRRRLVGGDQGALGHDRAADPPGDRAQHLGVGQVDLRRLHLGLCRRNAGRGLAFGGQGIVIVLVADGIDAAQRLVTMLPGLGGDERGLLLRERALRPIQRCLVQ